MYYRVITLIALSLCEATAPHTSSAQEKGSAALSVSPAYAYITPAAPYGSFRLSNDGTASVEILVSAQLGVIEADSSGEATNITIGDAGALRDLSPRLSFFPERLILEPGTEQLVRYLVEGVEALPDAGHITLMHFAMQERAPVQAQNIPAVATAINIEYNIVAPLVLLSRNTTPRLSARVLAETDSTITLLLINSTPHPFVGTIIVETQHEMGRIAAAVYTRRRVEVPLSTPLGNTETSVRFTTDFPGVAQSVRRVVTVPPPVALRR